MNTLFLIFFAFMSFAVNAAAQLAQTTTTDANKKPIYIAGASTSSVAAPAFTPTLVYNCYYMPLICENVANFAKSVNPNGGGDLAAAQLFYFDPNDGALTSRRRQACGCFDHDGCSTANSQGKTTNRVTAIAVQAPFNTLNTPITQANINIILAGTNPTTKNGVQQSRVAIPAVPGRFYGVNGAAFSCDEFPPATFIEGGQGAKTICAMSNWKLYTAQSSAGKWPLASGSGKDREQDWQGKSHNLLRNALNIGSKKNKRGWDTVYPFSFTTTTLQPQEQTKAYVIRAAAVTKAVMKRDGTLTTSTYVATTTLNVFGNETSELRRRDWDADGWRQYSNREAKVDSAVARLHVRQAASPMQTSASSSSSIIGSSQTSSFANSTISISSVSTGISATVSSTLHSIQVSSSSGTASISTAGSSSPSVVSGFVTSSSASVGGSSVTGTVLFASTPLTRASIVGTSPAASGSSVIAPSGTHTLGTNSAASGSIVTVSSPTGTFGANFSVSGIPVTASSATGTVRLRSSASGLITAASSATGKITGSSGNSVSESSPGKSTASITQSSGAVVAGNPVATSSASAVSSKVASASSAAALLVADPSNKQNAQAAQKQAHDAENAAAAMLSLAIGGSPLAGALTSLVGSLGTAAAAADAAVDATTAAGTSAAAAELVSDLEDATKDAEDVKENSDSDGKPSNRPSASEASQSKASQASQEKTKASQATQTKSQASRTSQTKASSQTTLRSLTSSVSITASSSRSLSSSASSQPKSSVSTQTAPSQCTLTFDVDGDEDPEVSDDYDDLDDDEGDDGVCNPVYGPGGSAVPCRATISSKAASGSGSGASVSATGASESHESGITSSTSRTSSIASSIRHDVSSTASSLRQLSSPPTSDNPTTHPGTSTVRPPPPPSTTTSTKSSPSPPPSTPAGPPTPSETSSNNKGSSLCSSIGGTTCQIAYSEYNDTYLYTAYTSYILPSGDNSIVNDLFSPFADNGCAAMFTCNSEANYTIGMTGRQIKDAFDNLYQHDKVKVCGSSYLSNGCHVTVNGCDNCKPDVPCGSLDAENIANTFPCYK